jgi:hypothetical protein
MTEAAISSRSEKSALSGGESAHYLNDGICCFQRKTSKKLKFLEVPYTIKESYLGKRLDKTIHLYRSVLKRNHQMQDWQNRRFGTAAQRI